MSLKPVLVLCAAIAVPALAYAQRGRPAATVPKPTKAEAQKLVESISGDKPRRSNIAISASSMSR